MTAPHGILRGVIALALFAAPSAATRLSRAECTGSGEVVVTDSAGDAPQGNPQLDILELRIAEHQGGAFAGRVLVRLRVNGLGAPAPAPAAWWTVSWRGPTPNGSETLVMSTCGNRRPSFSWSFSDPDGVSDSGAPDSAWYTPDGEIVLVLRPEQLGSPHAGDALTQVTALTMQFAHADTVCVPGAVTGTDGAPTGSYTFGACVLDAPRVTTAARLRLGPAFPNPARSVTRFELESPAAASGADATLRIHDAAGRAVRHMGSAGHPAGRSALTWDLLDDSGRRVRPGMYWLVVTLAEQHDTRAVLVLR